MKCKFSVKLLLKLCLLLLGLPAFPVLYGLAEWTHISIRKSYGYCTHPSLEQKDLRGRRFTTLERLDIAITHYLRKQILMDYLAIQKVEQAESLSLEDLEKRFALIRYGNREQFLEWSQ
jgi:hypothetical protein